jgi:EAL domain-containing protein (putative c-di-GMP-specific phosphodiesterase class I)
MTEAITRVVSVMGIEVVAEYVESIAILDKLREIGVDYAQGYGVSEPISLDDSSNISSLAETRMRKLRYA